VADPAAQQRCIARAAAALVDDGHLVVELIVARPFDADDPPGRRRSVGVDGVGVDGVGVEDVAVEPVAVKEIEVKEVGPDGVVLIVTDTDPVTRVVTAAHVELRHGEPVHLRPWRIRLVTLDELDRWAAEAGLELECRWSDWSGRTLDADAASAISIYRPRVS